MTFALITEGISEHHIIKHILQKYYREQEPDINQIQPKIGGGKQTTFGSWPEVLRYCSLKEELQNIFVDNDYLIIQIDTDKSYISPFGVSHTNVANKEKTVEELHTDVVAKLTSLIPADIFTAFSQRMLFAICIHTIECWLLPIYYSNNHKSAIMNCISKLNAELGKHNQDKIPTASKDKNSHIAIRAYEAILKNWKRKQDIITASQHNMGFSRFVTMLDSVTMTL